MDPGIDSCTTSAHSRTWRVENTQDDDLPFFAALPHMNATLVKCILERRPFLSMKELDSFLSPSLSKEQLTELYGKMFVHINLNSAAPEEIRMIPGTGNRMLREFKEYRPYDSIETFRREIGKYVKAREVARLEHYVTLE